MFKSGSKGGTKEYVILAFRQIGGVELTNYRADYRVLRDGQVAGIDIAKSIAGAASRGSEL